MDQKFGEKNIKNIYSVSDLNVYVRSILRKDDKLQNVWVKGEISNFNHYNGRHMYFVLKDEDSEIQCAMFRQYNKGIEFEPEEGMEVLCRGDVGLYLDRGQYQLVVKEMMLGGKGKLYLAYEQLKEKLAEEGLFEDEHKKELPFLPRKVGVVTSIEGAALRDIVRTLRERFAKIDIEIAPTSVQGEGSEKEIVEALKLLDERDVDVIIIGRGGGSIEDLWSFNEEVVARAVYDAETPIVSAVGHETDFLISDFVADERAATPTAAAELVVPRKTDLKRDLERKKRRGDNALRNIIDSFRERLDNVVKSPVFQKPELLLEDRYQRLDDLSGRLRRSVVRYLEDKRKKVKSQSERLEALGPLQTLGRGYSVVFDREGEVLSSVKDVDIGDIVRVSMSDGELKAEIKEVEYERDE